MIDFASIRPHRGSQHTGFEELVVQLARRRPPIGAKEFRRIEGSGGDAGAEALWLLHDGSVVGLQAKYFLRVRDIDWAQIDKSVETTLEKRPNVAVYRIAVACDLTDKGGSKGRGRDGWTSWDAHARRWRQQAKALGRSVKFEPITASELMDWVVQPSALGLARYWFETEVLSADWFSRQVLVASADLGERYTPQQHVVVTASRAFDGLARSRALRSRLREAVKATSRFSVVAKYPNCSQSVYGASTKAADALARVHSIDTELRAEPSEPWNLEQWIGDIRQAQDSLDAVERLLREDGTLETNHDVTGATGRPVGADTRYFEHALRETDYALENLKRVLQSPALRCDAGRVLVLIGEAGTGKSHLLAAEANRSISEQRLALLFLGQQFAQGNPWDQCTRSLGLPTWPRDELLGALDAAGEAHGARTLILIDAINEGAGANLWRHYLAGFLEELARYKYVAIVIACRTEYLPYAIPKPVLDAYPRAQLRGFVTFAEQEAAAVQYLDLRGIVRPAGPLLAPEFSHPLFLKAASDSLLKRNEFVFPRGLRGALKILQFYLDSVGSTLLPMNAEPVDLSLELRRALSSLAANMAECHRDYVPIAESERVVAEAFASRVPPTGLTWLEVLLRNGIIRRDPDPSLSVSEEFEASRDVVRIAFQRFQDHLIIRTALNGVNKADELFGSGGSLEWLIRSDSHYAWSGLFEALSVQVPETLGLELVDALPGDPEQWWAEWHIQESFIQSVRWRAVRTQSGVPTFTDRSLQLLNALGEPALSLLIEVAAVPEHPWNADLLQRNLWRWKLPERDRRWSKVLSFAVDDEGHPIHRIITWSTGGRLNTADDDILRLVAVVLTWTCATMSRPIRDKATKGLRRILTTAPQLHHWLLETFASVDDPYVLERLLAALYGAAYHLGDDARLEQIASSTFRLIFADGRPPRHLLTRDYSLAVLELAERFGKLPADIDLAKAKPPFPNPVRLRAPSKASLEKRKDQVGDHRIFWSCGGHGDFGRNTIASAVRNFSATRLTDAMPLTRRNKRDLFEEQVVKGDAGREKAFAALVAAAGAIWTFDVKDKGASFQVRVEPVVASVRKAEEMQTTFLLLLSEGERARYVSDAKRFLFGLNDPETDRDPPIFDLGWAQRWIANRAYSLGWTKNIFGEDHTSRSNYGQRSLVERVGKKYQWIALYELLAWLTDTRWLNSGWGQLPRPYAYPTDISFRRDVDPTFPAEVDVQQPPDGDWWRAGLELPSAENDDKLVDWVAANDPWQSARSVIFKEDNTGQQWITLYLYEGAREDHRDPGHVSHEIEIRRQAFLIVQCLLVEKKFLASSFSALRSTKSSHSIHFTPPRILDGPFWGELGWRATWPVIGWERIDGLPDGIVALKPVAEFVWESQLDASEPNGLQLRVPAAELIAALFLDYPNPRHPRMAKGSEGQLVYVDYKSDDGADGAYAAMIRKDAFEQFLRDQELGCVWIIYGERNAWPNGRLEAAAYRSFGSVLSFDAIKTRLFEWETGRDRND